MDYRGSTIKVKEKLSRPAKTVPALRKITSRHGHKITHEGVRKTRRRIKVERHEYNYQKLHTKNTTLSATRKGPETDYTRTDTSGRGRSHDRNPATSGIRQLLSNGGNLFVHLILILKLIRWKKRINHKFYYGYFEMMQYVGSRTWIIICVCNFIIFIWNHDLSSKNLWI